MALKSLSYLADVRRNLIKRLWALHQQSVPQARLISHHLHTQLGVNPLPLDHFAIIDLPSPYSGMEHLKKIFETLGFCERGRDYLPEKQNAFLWMAEIDTLKGPMEQALPQVVLADFRLKELPKAIQAIVEQYAQHVSHSPLNKIEALAKQCQQGNLEASIQLTTLLSNYFNQRDWPLPSVEDFETIKSTNELLAWTLVFGRQPNHFTFQIHRIPFFDSLTTFNQYVIDQLGIAFNEAGQRIKGSQSMGLEQSSTLGELIEVTLSNGVSSISTGFVEFIWRYSLQPGLTPRYWKEYFNDFIALNANRVVESLYSVERENRAPHKAQT